jgi:hypothetical protein
LLAGRGGPCDHRYRYLSLPPNLLSPFGERFPVGAFVVLDRRDGAATRLTSMSADEMLSRVISRNFADRPRPAEAVDRLARVMDARPCLHLAYAEPLDAAAVLQAEFGGDVPDVARNEAPGSGIDPAPPLRRAPILADQRYRRRPGIAVRSFSGSHFLADRTAGAIHRLNPTAAVVWRMLRRPISAREAAALIAQAFPNLEHRQVERDVDGLFAAFDRAQLITVVGQASAAPTCRADGKATRNPDGAE